MADDKPMTWEEACTYAREATRAWQAMKMIEQACLTVMSKQDDMARIYAAHAEWQKKVEERKNQLASMEGAIKAKEDEVAARDAKLHEIRARQDREEAELVKTAAEQRKSVIEARKAVEKELATKGDRERELASAKQAIAANVLALEHDYNQRRASLEAAYNEAAAKYQADLSKYEAKLTRIKAELAEFVKSAQV